MTTVSSGRPVGQRVAGRRAGRTVGAEQHRPVVEHGPGGQQGQRRRRRRRRRRRAVEVPGKPAGLRPQRAGVPGRQHPGAPAPPSAAVAGARARRLGQRGRLGEHQVAVGAAHAERADPGRPAGRSVRPGPVPVAPRRRSQLVERDRRVRPVWKLQAGRQLAVREAERDLEQPGDAGRALQVADVGLHRADQQRLVGRPARAERGARARPPRSGRRPGCRCRAARRTGPRPGRPRPGRRPARITSRWACSLGDGQARRRRRRC